MNDDSADRLERLVRNITLHSPHVFAFIRSLVPVRADAEEILQETHLSLFKKVDESNQAANFAAWACGVARIEVLRFRDRQKPGWIVFDTDFVNIVAGVFRDRGHELDERRIALQTCVDKLTERDRDVIRRRYLDGKSIQVVAAELGRSTEALYKVLARIRTALFDCIERSVAAAER